MINRMRNLHNAIGIFLIISGLTGPGLIISFIIDFLLALVSSFKLGSIPFICTMSFR